MNRQVLLMVCLSLTSVATSPARYDQRQSGKYNVRVALKQIKIVSLGFPSSDSDADYDLGNYDYEDPSDPADLLTGKPPAVNATSGWSVNTTPTTTVSPSSTEVTTALSVDSTSTVKEYTPYDVIVTTKRSDTKYDPSKRMRCRAGYYKDHAGRCRKLRNQGGGFH